MLPLMRGFLIAAVIAAAAGGATFPASAEPPAATAFGAFTIDAANDDCVPMNVPGLGPTRLCDPINLVFPDQSLAAVVARLQAAGWQNTSGTVQWLQAGDSTALVPVGWQLGWPDGPDPTQRNHVRLWQIAPDLTVGNVHHEHGEPHKIDMAWDQAEAFVAAQLCSSWCGHLALESQATLQGGAVWRGWSNDTVATVIPANAPATPPAQPKLAPHRRHKHRPKHA
jgi:hypothetical protein